MAKYVTVIWLLILVLAQDPRIAFGSKSSKSTNKMPNIVFILADDLGWDDVSFHGSEISTPNIDRLAKEGIILNNYYVQPICTPTRAALLTGRYPIHTGMQHYVIVGTEPYGLPLNETTMAQHLKDLGYDTHIVGKWHLGFCKPEYLPENRGFDSHFGYYMGEGDHFDHYSYDGSYMGYDLHQNGQPEWNYSEVYSTELYTREAERIIHAHDQSKPLFLYLAEQTVHVGNQFDKLQAPQKYVDRFPHIKNEKRRTFAGMASALDDSVGAVYKALQDSGMAENTIFVFSTDNGGPANGYDGNAACNWPLRGTKNTLWQGGVRGVGFVHSPKLLEKSGYVTENLMHVTDWLPTLYAAAGGNVSRLGNIDGIDQWNALSKQTSTSRKEVLLNIDPIIQREALIVGDFKFLNGSEYKQYSGWYPPPADSQLMSDMTHFDVNEDSIFNRQSELKMNNEKNLLKFVSQKSNNILKGRESAAFFSRPQNQNDGTEVSELIHFMESQYEHLIRNNKLKGNSLVFEKEGLFNGQAQKEVDTRPSFINKASQEEVLVHCGPKPIHAETNCKPEKAPCLYNLRDDPCEYTNLADLMPEVIELLQKRMEYYHQTMVPTANVPEDPNGNPQLHRGVWEPWL